MTALATLTLLRPLLLLALIPLAALWLILHRRTAADAPEVPSIAPHLLAALTIGRAAASRLRAPDLLIPAAMLMTLAAAGPAWRPAPSPFVTETAPLVIALDLSPSMSGTDVAPSRLERAKQKIRDLNALRAGGRVALVAYAGTAHLVMPLTDDPTVLLPFLEALSPEIMPDAGRTASAALTLAESLLAHEDTPGSILFVTDGVDPGDIAAFPAGGSARAALIVAPDPGSEIADWSRRAAVTTVLVSIDDGDVRTVERDLASSLARAATAEGRLQDDGWLLALPAGLLVLLRFRRGTTLRWGALVLGLAASLPHGARADDLADWFWTTDQQGARLYAAHRYPEAAEAFADPEARAQSEDEQTGPPDDSVEDLAAGQGKRVRIDASSQLSEDAADQWMRAVETKPANFLKSRFAIEAQPAR